ncbi:hypothetical protein ABZ614_39030 [Streptomyces sp. NPDC013178]|uniref:hypothetical protein n=1 Tax=Streptomyces sp. NPDC013178 TaxID=3155118 RepID=UPI0033DD56D0
MTTISIHLLGDTREFQAEELPPVTSAHTGRQLRRVALEFRVPSNRQDELDAELKAATGKEGHPLRGTDVNWSVSDSRYSYTVGAQPEVSTYNLELQEAEDLRASAVEFEGLALVPSAYREWIDDEGEHLVLTFVTETAGEEDQRLEELVVERSEAYFDVIRRGVSDTPVRMRFGRCLWQETESGAKRHNLSLVADEGQEASDSYPFALLNEPQLSRTTEAAVANARALAVLLEELQAQGVLSEEVADKVRAAAVPHRITAKESREFSRTYDLDQYWG